MFLSTFISNSSGTQIHHPTAQASFWIHFPFSIKNPIQTQSPVSSLTASSCSPPPEAHVHAHTHTHTSYIQSGSPIWASCTSSLILSVSCPPVDLQYCCHCNSGPQHLSEPPLHKVRSKVLWAQLSHFHRSGLGTVPLGIGCMDSRDNSQKQSLVEASAES